MAEMIGLDRMTLDEALSDDTFGKIYDEEDDVERSRMLLSLEEHCATFKYGRAKFKTMARSYQKVHKELEAKKKRDQLNGQVDGFTGFESDGKYENMRCGSWLADESGIYLPIERPPFRAYACPHPILPVEQLANIETGEQKVKIAFKKNHRWQELTVNRGVLASSNKILALAEYGVSVNSENSKALVRYMSDVESLNEDEIPIQRSTTKLGWHGKDFTPYDTGDVIFDGEAMFSHLFESIKTKGSCERWIEEIKKVRNRPEVKIMIAASLASVLLELIGSSQSFFVDFYGMTEAGKTVLMRIGASIWADPSTGCYIGDFKTTDTALEVKADMLNNLPLMLDDTAKASKRIMDNFEQVVYDLTSQRGKARSNKELGVNRIYQWKNIIVTNGEMALNTYMGKGGALNRILEVRMRDEKIFDNPAELVGCLKANYGHFGRLFVDTLKMMGDGQVQEIYDTFVKQLRSPEKLEKQVNSLAYLMTADYIATKLIFQDDNYITMDEATDVLSNRSQVSDNERCYAFIMDKVSMNMHHFSTKENNQEQWGLVENGWVYFYPAALNALCESGGFKKEMFVDWCIKNDKAKCSPKRKTYSKKFGSVTVRSVCIKIEDLDEPAEEQFLDLSGADQEELPFD